MAAGQKLKSLLEERGISVNQLSNATGIAKPTLYAIINRDSSRADIDILSKIAAALGVSLDFFASKSTTQEVISLSPNERILVDNYRHSDSDGRDAIMYVSSTFRKIHEKNQ